MIRSKALRHLAAYSVSLPTLAAPAKVAKETVYMPSTVAARVLGGGNEPQPQADGEPVGDTD
ncbi:MAG TPA: hypothetical protein VGG78_07225 [Gemmatimonadaceae bacterium]|jgi:hypothetical protein